MLQQVKLAGGLVELFVPEPAAVKEAYQKKQIAFPFWSRIWPAAQVLSQFLLAHPQYTREKSVLEIGAGLGLPSLIAARNAASVLCTDTATEAVQVVRQSAANAGLTNFTTKVVDWHSLPPGLTADVLLLSDINYEPDAFALQRSMLEGFLQKGTTILLSTPQRLMAKTFVAALLPFCVHQEESIVQEGAEAHAITLMVLKKETGIPPVSMFSAHQ